ncbi:hypothetical protein K1T71_008325 [Dendrolimus kikuchii]|uniref:Uncharacterized protein n=1 Tax=Dendrolimus kikuchii TaxID=765133 RepID=A0ACC1CX45_9NEOP|nr:hypothetical protein K1T71_008325 [Dendrolimus kikuchii]
MTLDNILSQVGLGTKQISERYSEYGAPADQHIFYTYEPSSSAHGHAPISKYSYSGGLKSNASMSALTLLAFLFFLHILQQCIKEHMNDMSSAPVMVMTAGRESEQEITKSLTKIDKSGLDKKSHLKGEQHGINQKRNNIQIYERKNPYEQIEYSNENNFMKMNVAEYSPKIDKQKYKDIYKTYVNRSSIIPGFVTAMDDDNL